MGLGNTLNLILKPYSKYILYIGVIVSAIVLGNWLYKTYAVPVLVTENKQYNDIANRGTRSSEIEILFFSANWCPHCRKCKPDWDKFSQRYHNSEVNGHKILCVDVDTTSENDETVELVKKYKIDGIPVVIALVDSEVITFEGKITYESLDAFLGELK